LFAKNRLILLNRVVVALVEAQFGSSATLQL